MKVMQVAMKVLMMRSGTYLYGVAVDGLPSPLPAAADLQDVVGHVAGRPGAVPHLPPLLPVVQHLTGIRTPASTPASASNERIYLSRCSLSLKRNRNIQLFCGYISFLK